MFLTFVCFAGSAIKCWDCRSDADPKCSDPFDNTTFAITDCKQQQLEFLPDAKATMCRKIRQKGKRHSYNLLRMVVYVIYFLVNGVWKYIRSCAYLGEPGIAGDERFCLMRTGTYNIFMEYCTCNSKDGCNGASALTFSSLLTLTLVFVVRNVRWLCLLLLHRNLFY